MTDRDWMLLAWQEGRKGLGLTAPNPPVGAALVRAGKLLAVGWHRGPGQAHAEIVALRQAIAVHGPDAPQGATLYITLEPCSTHGRTPPCCDAIIEHRIERVVYACDDPNPAHAGRARQRLASAGIHVDVGIAADEVRQLLDGFASAMTRHRPWIIAKSAYSLDARITRPDAEGPWLSSPASREDVQTLRCDVDAILTSGSTLRHDNPRLTLRIPHPHGPKKPLQRIVVTRSGEIPPDASVFHDADAERTFIAALAATERPKSLPAAVGWQSFADWPSLFNHLVEALGIHTVLVETGGQMLGVLLDLHCIDEWVGYLPPILTGGQRGPLSGAGFHPPDRCPRLDQPTYHRIGDDVRVRGRVVYDRVDQPTHRNLKPAVFFDRDGVVNDPGDRYYVTCPDEFHFNPAIFPALRLCRSRGYTTVLVTSQRGVGKGKMTRQQLDDIHEHMQRQLGREGLAFDLIKAYCGESADAPGAKPRPDMLLEAARELGIDLAASWTIGDSDRDIHMGRRAGTATIGIGKNISEPDACDHYISAVDQLPELLAKLI